MADPRKMSRNMANVMRDLLVEWAVIDKGNKCRDPMANVGVFYAEIAEEGIPSVHIRALGRPIPEAPDGMTCCRDLRDMLNVFIEACEESMSWCHPENEEEIP